MKKKFRLNALLMLMAFAFTGFATAKAQTSVVFGEEYQVAAFGDFEGTIVIEQEGVLSVSGSTGGALTLNGTEIDSSSFSYYPPIVTYSVSPGTYVYSIFSMDEITLTFTFEAGEGGGNTGGGNPGVEDSEFIVLDYTYEIPAFGNFDKKIVVETDAVLSVLGNPYVDGALMTLSGVEVAMAGNLQYTDAGQIATYEVSAGTYQYYLGFTMDPISLTFSLEEGEGGNDGPDDPVDVPEGYEPLGLYRTYYTESVASIQFYYTPTSDGVLTVTQTGSYDTHIFSAPPVYSDDYAYENNYDIMLQSDGYTVNEQLGGYDLSYGLKAGKTYFVVAKLSEYDEISSMTFIWDGENNDNEILLDTPIIINYESPVYTFTAPVSGILSVQWSNPSPSGSPVYSTGLLQGGDQYFLYKDYGLTIPVPIVSGGDGDGGWLVKFNVTQGEKYYLHNPEIPLYQVEFTLQAGSGVTASIVAINPTPGMAYDFVNYRYYWNLETAPNGPTVESVSLTYTGILDDEPTTIELRNPAESGGGALQIPADEITRLMENEEIAPDTQIIFTLHGLRADGVYVTENLMTECADYIKIGENGEVQVIYLNSVAITPETATMPEYLYQESYAGDKSLVGSITYSGKVKSVSEVSIIEGYAVPGGQHAGDEPPASVFIPSENISIDDNTVTIDFAGVNMTSIPAGTVTIWVSGVLGENGLWAIFEDGSAVGAYYVTMVAGSSAVNGIEVENGLNKIYNMNGVQIDNSDINSLPKGLYIINGKKVMVK